MPLHQTTGRRSLGFALAATTMFMWGVLPLALAGLLRQLDALTINWARFVASALILGAALAMRGRLPAFARLGRLEWGLLAIATLFLGINYGTYILGLAWTSPANAQVMIQLAPLLLAFGGIFVFRETFNRIQWTGYAVMLCGLGLFFADQLTGLLGDMTRYLRGNATIVVASITWAIYGLAQKQLLHTLPSQAIMLCIYTGCALLFTPLATPSGLLALDAAGVGLLVFCTFNTVLAYGAFSEALQHWEASRVSAVLALTPLATLALGRVVEGIWPGAQPPEVLGAAGLLGAALTVAGSLTASLGARSATPEDSLP